MRTQSIIHHPDAVGILSTFDRLIFKGHLLGFHRRGGLESFLGRIDVLIKDFKEYMPKVSRGLKAYAEQFAKDAGRPYIYLEHAETKATGEGKEAMARAIAEEYEVTEGLVCVLATLEPTRSFEIRVSERTGRIYARNGVKRPCLHFYFYFIDPEFGFMHVRLASWFPMEIQIYINGREWLARKMDAEGIGYERQANCFVRIDDMARAQEMCEKFAHREWARVWDAFARKVNPYLETITEAMGWSYYWAIGQSEYATDVMFKDRASLLRVYPALVDLAMHAFGAEDVLRFLGRKPHPNLKAEVGTHLYGRPECCRVKHRLAKNSLKMYDKGSVLRIETTINNPREFKITEANEAEGATPLRWVRMKKGVSCMWRYAQVSSQANSCYLEALEHAQPKGKEVEELDSLCRSCRKDGKRYARFNPVTAEDTHLFAAVMAGEHCLTGFRNADLQGRLYQGPARSPQEQRQRTARVSRLIAKLRGHGLVAKVRDCRLYRVTETGYRLMGAALHCRNEKFPVFAREALALDAA